MNTQLNFFHSFPFHLNFFTSTNSQHKRIIGIAAVFLAVFAAIYYVVNQKWTKVIKKIDQNEVKQSDEIKKIDHLVNHQVKQIISIPQLSDFKTVGFYDNHFFFYRVDSKKLKMDLAFTDPSGEIKRQVIITQLPCWNDKFCGIKFIRNQKDFGLLLYFDEDQNDTLSLYCMNEIPQDAMSLSLMEFEKISCHRDDVMTWQGGENENIWVMHKDHSIIYYDFDQGKVISIPAPEELQVGLNGSYLRLLIAVQNILVELKKQNESYLMVGYQLQTERLKNPTQTDDPKLLWQKIWETPLQAEDRWIDGFDYIFSTLAKDATHFKLLTRERSGNCEFIEIVYDALTGQVISDEKKPY